MAKKLTQKQKKEKDEKEKLRRRLVDILYGAHGDYAWDADPYETDYFLGMESFETIGNYLGVIKQLLIPKDKEWLMQFHSIEHFTTIDSAVDYLYKHGIRA